MVAVLGMVVDTSLPQVICDICGRKRSLSYITVTHSKDKKIKHCMRQSCFKEALKRLEIMNL